MEEKDKEEKDMEQKMEAEMPKTETADTGGEEKNDAPVTEENTAESQGTAESPAEDADAPGEGEQAAEEQPPKTEHGRESEGIPNTEDTSETEDAPRTDGETDSRGDGKTKTGFFGKKKKKDKLEETVEELTDKLKRSMAEFDNFRKRTEKEKSQMYEIGARDVIEKILPVVDNFERGLDAMTDEDKAGGVGQGMEMIYKQLATVLEQLDVKPIEAKGKPFDPDFHNAVMHEENEEAGENEVVEELQKGYTYRGTVVRHSMVKVAN